MRWLRISCEEFEMHLDIMGEHKRVYSSLTDMDGEYGAPIVKTVWCRDGADDEPILKGIRYPRYPDDRGTGDRMPCEHYFYVSY